MQRSNTAPAWRRAFLRELARSGSVASAADACGIDRSSAYQLRNRNAAFAASWERAQGAARARLLEGDRSPSRLREGLGVGAAESDACGLAHPRPLPQAGGGNKRPKLRPNETVRASKDGRPCIARLGPGRWSAKVERAFLDELTASANVKAAARAAGVSAQAAYARRGKWPAFAAEWQAALAEGYARIETLLICAATTTLDPEPVPEEAREGPEMSVEQAMNLFKLHRASVQGGKPQRYDWRQQAADVEDVRAEILRKIAAMERVRGRQG